MRPAAAWRPARRRAAAAAAAAAGAVAAGASASRAYTAQVAQAAHNADTAEFQFDAVGVEVERFKFLAPEEVQPFVRDNGLLDEFKMMYKFRHRFPLHFIVFKQTASHIPHEANVEQVGCRPSATHIAAPLVAARRCRCPSHCCPRRCPLCSELRPPLTHECELEALYQLELMSYTLSY